jgi:hypothetical protein
VVNLKNLTLLTAFALALTLSAGLLFNIQPMIGKMLLPLVGGAPAVWNVAMAFFQISLLTGYLVAHLLGKLPPLGHALGYAALLGLAALLLPITLPAGWQPDPALGPALSVFKVLVISVALPFIALSLVRRPCSVCLQRPSILMPPTPISSMLPPISAASPDCCSIRSGWSPTMPFPPKPACGGWAILP